MRRLIRPPARPPAASPDPTEEQTVLAALEEKAAELRRLRDELDADMLAARKQRISFRKIGKAVQMSPQTVLDRTGGPGEV